MEPNLTNLPSLKSIIYKIRPLSLELRKQMIEYSAFEDKTRLKNVLMSFIRRIETNLTSVAILSHTSYRNNGRTYLKLPMGLVLRNCFVDIITAFYLMNKTEKEAEEEIDIMNRDYVKSFKKRYEILGEESESEPGKKFYDDLYWLILEDVFPNYLNFEKPNLSTGNFPLLENEDIRSSKSNDRNCYKTDCIFKELKNEEVYGSIIGEVYLFYKYFSQYEHFSEYSHGDSLAPYGEDNVSFVDAIETIKKSVHLILSHVKKGNNDQLSNNETINHHNQL